MKKQEQEEGLQRVANGITKVFKLESVPIKLKDVSKGKAHYEKRYITFPLWVIEQKEPEYILYYLIHEISHIIEYDITNQTNHGEYFKKLEQAILKEFGYGIKYKKAYAKEIYKIINK